MNNNAERPNKVPESYGPRSPEILRMAENAGKSELMKKHEVRTANGGSYIDGVPKLKWGEFKDCTYCGCAALLLNVMGRDASYERVMGLTGSCYRLSMCYGWDPGSTIVNTSYNYLGFDNACGTDYNANRAFGFELCSVKDETRRNEMVLASIDSGVPVLQLGGRGEPEWNILTGYERTASGIKYFGRSYFDGSDPADEPYTENRYTLANKYPGDYPGLFVKLFDKSCEPTSARDALKLSLETCLKMFAPTSKPKFEDTANKIGYGAYEFMIDGMSGNEYGEVRIHFGNLLDARRAAHIYLEESARLLSGENRKRLTSVSAMYKEMFDVLSAVLPYDRLYRDEFESGLSAELRGDIAAALKKMLLLEKQARVIVNDILNNWNDNQ